MDARRQGLAMALPSPDENSSRPLDRRRAAARPAGRRAPYQQVDSAEIARAAVGHGGVEIARRIRYRRRRARAESAVLTKTTRKNSRRTDRGCDAESGRGTP